MPDKTVIMTEPVANDVCRITIRCDGQGNLITLQADVKVDSNDPSSSHASSMDFDTESINQATSDAITSLVNETLAEFKSQKGF